MLPNPTFTPVLKRTNPAGSCTSQVPTFLSTDSSQCSKRYCAEHQEVRGTIKDSLGTCPFLWGQWAAPRSEVVRRPVTECMGAFYESYNHSYLPLELNLCDRDHKPEAVSPPFPPLEPGPPSRDRPRRRRGFVGPPVLLWNQKGLQGLPVSCRSGVQSLRSQARGRPVPKC